MTPPTREPEVIAEARRTGTLSVGAILAEYDRVCAERDAAVRELEETRKREALSDAIVDECDSDITNLVQERATLRARLAACERVVEAARAVVLDAWKQHGYDQYNVGTATIAALRAALAAETQTTPHAGGTDA